MFLTDRGQQYTTCIRNERRSAFGYNFSKRAYAYTWIVKPHCLMMSAISLYRNGCLSFSYHLNRYVLVTTNPIPVLRCAVPSHPSHLQASPQLWKLEIIRDRTRTNEASPVTARLNLKHSFALNVPTSIAGSCYFGGTDEQFVFCVGKGG